MPGCVDVTQPPRRRRRRKERMLERSFQSRSRDIFLGSDNEDISCCAFIHHGIGERNAQMNPVHAPREVEGTNMTRAKLGLQQGWWKEISCPV
jgi:hypothetical protein